MKCLQAEIKLRNGRKRNDICRRFRFDTIEKANVQVLEKIEAWGYISYKVFNPATGRVYKANEEQLSSSGSTMQYDENYLRYVTLLSKIKNKKLPVDSFLLLPAGLFRCRTSSMC